MGRALHRVSTDSVPTTQIPVVSPRRAQTPWHRAMRGPAPAEETPEQTHLFPFFQAIHPCVLRSQSLPLVLHMPPWDLGRSKRLFSSQALSAAWIRAFGNVQSPQPHPPSSSSIPIFILNPILHIHPSYVCPSFISTLCPHPPSSPPSSPLFSILIPVLHLHRPPPSSSPFSISILHLHPHPHPPPPSSFPILIPILHPHPHPPSPSSIPILIPILLPHPHPYSPSSILHPHPHPPSPSSIQILIPTLHPPPHPCPPPPSSIPIPRFAPSTGTCHTGFLPPFPPRVWRTQTLALPAWWKPGGTEGQTHHAVPPTHRQDRPCQLGVEGPASPSCRALGLLVPSQPSSLPAGWDPRVLGGGLMSQPELCWEAQGLRISSPKQKMKTRKIRKKRSSFTKLLLLFYFPAQKQTLSPLTLPKPRRGHRSAPRPCPQHPGHGAVLEAAARRSCPLPPQGPAAL